MIDYVRLDETTDSSCFGAVPVEEQAMHIIVDSTSRTSAYGALEMRSSEWEKPVVYRAHRVMHMLYLRKEDERNYLLMLYGIFLELDEVWTMPLAMLAYC